MILAVALAGPTMEAERAVVEASVGVEDVYPPRVKDTPVHPTYGVAVSASVHGKSSFRAMVGFGFDHVVKGWLGDPEEGTTAGTGAYAGTTPSSFRGHLFRLAPVARLGIENSWAYGFAGLTSGYALRIASLRCVDAPCGRTRAVDHGVTFGLSLGALAAPSPKLGLRVGGEVGLDWAWFPSGHVGLAHWNQGMSARIVVGYAF